MLCKIQRQKTALLALVPRSADRLRCHGNRNTTNMMSVFLRRSVYRSQVKRSWSWCFRETNSILAVTLYGIRLLVQRHSVTIQLSVYFDFIWLDNNCNSTKGILQYEGTGMCYITYKLNHKCKCKVGADSDIFIGLWNVSHGLYIIYTSFLRYLNGLSLMAQPGTVNRHFNKFAWPKNKQ